MKGCNPEAGNVSEQDICKERRVVGDNRRPGDLSHSNQMKFKFISQSSYTSEVRVFTLTDTLYQALTHGALCHTKCGQDIVCAQSPPSDWMQISPGDFTPIGRC